MSFSFRSAGVLLTLVSMTLSSPALADVMQPDGTLVPRILSPTGVCDSGLNVGACLDRGEMQIGGQAGTISAVHDAHVDKETFDPKCQLTFTTISKGGSGYASSFGWYPVKAGNVPPPLSDLHVFLTCAEIRALPATITNKVLTIPAGISQVGFFIANNSYMPCPATTNADGTGTLMMEPTNIFYTERKYNGLDRNGRPISGLMQNIIRVLTWQSVARPDAFYFGWEDDGVNTDNNFNDIVARVGGIDCAGGGAACDTGMKGLCAKGTMQCRAGVLTCVPDQTGIPEKCNAIDDNCDGNIDEGDLCDPGYVCYRGTCVPNCARGEFTCVGGSVCEVDAGVCVDVACRGKTCPDGQVCRGGNCIGECVDVKCPYGQACQHGGCVDVCSSLKCDDGFACTVSYPDGPDKEPVGVCETCGCQGCAMGTTCSQLHCVPNDCAMVTCAAGTHCVSGACVDNCMGAMCPTGQKCDKGGCVADGSSVKDAGAPANDSGPVVIVPPTTTTGSSVASATSTTSTTGAGGAGSTSTSGAGGSDARKGATETSSCGCRIPGGGSPAKRGAPWALLALAILARRRRFSVT